MRRRARAAVLRNDPDASLLFALLSLSLSFSRVSPVHKKASSVSGRCNRRQVKPRNKNSGPRRVWRAYHPRAPPGDSANNMARCLMTRSITAPCPVFERRIARRRRVHVHVLLSLPCDDDTTRDETRRDGTGRETRDRADSISQGYQRTRTRESRPFASGSSIPCAHAIIPLRANDLSVRIPYGPALLCRY